MAQDSPVPAPTDPPSDPPADVRRPRLSRDLIVETAIDQIDRVGLSGLTMRQLAECLGVEAMSIYHHVDGREDLLEAVVAALAETARVDPDRVIGPSNGWQAYLTMLAHSIRHMALAHPNAFPLVATRPPAAPWLRPPVRSLEMVEDFLHAMTSREMGDEQAVHTYKVFTSFLLGNLLLEVSQLGAQTGPPREPLDEGDAEVPQGEHELALNDFPHLERVREIIRRGDADADFAEALEAMLDRLDLQFSQ